MGLTFQAIGQRLGVSDRQAQILCDEHWQTECDVARISARRIRSDLAAHYFALQDIAFAHITSLARKFNLGNPDGGTIHIADFNGLIKMSNIVIQLSAKLAKLLCLDKSPVSAPPTRDLTDYLGKFK